MVTLNQSEQLPNTQTVQKNANVNGAIKKNVHKVFGVSPFFQKNKQKNSENLKCEEMRLAQKMCTGFVLPHCN